jgi:antitoxin HicB
MRKTLRHGVRQYTAVFESDPDVGGYTVTIPDLPGCISEGNTFEAALKNIQEAASLYLEVMTENGRKFEDRNRNVIIAPVEVAV